MTLANFGGAQPFLWPAQPAVSANITGTLSMTATGQKIAVTGRVINKDLATKTLKQVHIPLATVVKAGGSTVQVDVQGWSGTSSPLIPDGSNITGTGALIANATLASNTVVASGTFGTQPSVTYGQPIAIVISWGTYNVADSIQVNCVNQLSNWSPTPAATFNAVAWTGQSNNSPAILLEFDDGTFGTLDGTFHYSALNTHSYNNGSTPDEYALRFQVPFPAKIVGAQIYMTWGSNDNRDYDVVLYDAASSALATVSMDGSWRNTASAPSWSRAIFPPQSLTANTTYRLSVKPTTANSIAVYSFDVGSNAHLQHAGGIETYTSTRTDAGAWTDVTTRRVLIALELAAFDDAAQNPTHGARYLRIAA